MFEITYLGTEDRARLQAIQEAMRDAKSAEERMKFYQESEEIQKRAKPLKDCNVEECVELRTQIFEKFDKLQRIGRYGHAINFKRMLVAIEQRQAMLHREETMKEAERLKKKMEKKKESLTERIKATEEDEKSVPKVRPSTRRSRWTTGVGELD